MPPALYFSYSKTAITPTNRVRKILSSGIPPLKSNMTSRITFPKIIRRENKYNRMANFLLSLVCSRLWAQQKKNIGADILPIYLNQIGAPGMKAPIWSIIIVISAMRFNVRWLIVLFRGSHKVLQIVNRSFHLWQDLKLRNVLLFSYQQCMF